MDFLERLINQDNERFEANRKGIEDYYIESRELINNKSTSVLELKRKRASLKKCVVDIKAIYNRVDVHKIEKPQFEFLPELNEKHKQLLEQAIEQLTLLAKSAKEAIAFRKLKGEIDKASLPPEQKIISRSNSVKTTRPETLLEIWLPDRTGSTKQYQEFIEHLKAPYPEIDSSFITEINNTLYWNKTPKKGFASYLAGFIYTCLKKKWIKDDYSGEDYKFILGKTFNVVFNKKPFEQIAAKTFDEKYLKPFKNLPSNI